MKVAFRFLSACAVTATVSLAPALATAEDGGPRPARSLRGLNFTLQNYFNDRGTLIPFFGAIPGSVGSGVEVAGGPGGYIYEIDLSDDAISMAWNTDPAFDVFEPYVGQLAGLSRDQAAAIDIADEYHFTFDRPIYELDIHISSEQALVPEYYFADPYTLVVAVPGGTAIGDGFNAEIVIGGASGSLPSDLGGLSFTLQNYFNDRGTLTPFFGAIPGSVGSGVEVPGGPGGYIYEIDLAADGITLAWNADPSFDVFEPFVGKLAGLTPEQASAIDIADEYHFTFDRPIYDLDISVSADGTLVPEYYFADPYTLVIAVPGGTRIGDGFNAEIVVGRPSPSAARGLGGLSFTLQNYFNDRGSLTPFFQAVPGSVGPGVEVPGGAGGYIYEIDLSGDRITLAWNTDPAFDAFEPYVGGLAGLTREQAAGIDIADEYHFTFDRPIYDLDIFINPNAGSVFQARVMRSPERSIS
ncbi:MAG: hypothetical protein AAFZ18_19495 [Myxococcota bacterium]